VNYYEIYDRYSDELLARGTARECRDQLGCSSMDSFYALANRSKRGINKNYRVVILKGGETDYPVLGKDSPIHKMEEKRNEEKGLPASCGCEQAKRILGRKDDSEPSVNVPAVVQKMD